MRFRRNPVKVTKYVDEVSRDRRSLQIPLSEIIIVVDVDVVGVVVIGKSEEIDEKSNCQKRSQNFFYTKKSDLRKFLTFFKVIKNILCLPYGGLFAHPITLMGTLLQNLVGHMKTSRFQQK